IVHPDVAAEIVERIAKRAVDLRLGDPTDPSTDVGPVINRASSERIAGMVGEALSEGASLSCGGRARHDVFGCDGGSFFEPTVLTGVEPQHRIAREEVFGPVLAVMEIADLDEAIDGLNSVEFGPSPCIRSPAIHTA